MDFEAPIGSLSYQGWACPPQRHAVQWEKDDYLSRVAQVATELAPRSMAVKAATPVRMSCESRKGEFGVEKKHRQGLTGSHAEYMEIRAGKLLETGFNTALG